MIDSIFGYPVVETEVMADTVQARNHKKKRINKKWRKRYGFKKVPWKKIAIIDHKIYGHPKTLAAIKKRMVCSNENP